MTPANMFRNGIDSARDSHSIRNRLIIQLPGQHRLADGYANLIGQYLQTFLILLLASHNQ